MTGTEISQASGSSPWTLTAVETVIAGYDETKCFRCTSGSTNFDQTFQIIQDPAPDCSTSLTVKTIATPLSSHPYASAGPGKFFDIATFFVENALPAGCTLACSVGDTCGNSLTGTEIGQVPGTGLFPWGFTAVENVITGYDHTKCYRCVSGFTNFDATFQIIQTGDCSTSLSAKTISVPLSSHPFSNGGSGKTFDISTFFTQNTR